MPLVAVEKYAAIQLDPVATTAPEGTTNASMTWCQSAEVLISVLARVSDHVKSGQRTGLLLLPRSANELQPSGQQSNEKLPPQESRKTCRTRIARLLLLAILTAIPKIPITLRSRPSLRKFHNLPPIFGLPPIPTLITRYVAFPDFVYYGSRSYQTEMTTPYRRPPSYMYEQGSYTKSSYPRQLDVNTFQFPDSHPPRKYPIPHSPSTETGPQAWWNRILSSDT